MNEDALVLKITAQIEPKTSPSLFWCRERNRGANTCLSLQSKALFTKKKHEPSKPHIKNERASFISIFHKQETIKYTKMLHRSEIAGNLHK